VPNQPALYRKLHGLLTLVWAGLAIPTLLVWSRSILWVALISVYANFAAHAAAWQAARAEVRAEDRANERDQASSSPSSGACA
jgi:hypothetical protein